MTSWLASVSPMMVRFEVTDRILAVDLVFVEIGRIFQGIVEHAILMGIRGLINLL